MLKPLLHPIRTVRDHLADRRVLRAMTPMQRQVVKAFDVPPRLVGAPKSDREAAARAARIQAETDYFNAVTERVSMPTAIRFVCPAPVADLETGRRRPCQAPLPCEDHNVPDPQIGAILYGASFAEAEYQL